ncbi:hypothetical protein G6F46_015063 [Rhizopus delemar]|nr:hypothetical protein G6F46_015063 [Rhizopus delemar]
MKSSLPEDLDGLSISRNAEIVADFHDPSARRHPIGELCLACRPECAPDDHGSRHAQRLSDAWAERARRAL